MLVLERVKGGGERIHSASSQGHFLFNLHAVLKRAAIKKSKNDLIHAEEGEDHFTDICSVGEYWLRIPRGFDLHLNLSMPCFLLWSSSSPPGAAVSSRRMNFHCCCSSTRLPKAKSSVASPPSLCWLPQLLHAAPLREPCKAWGQSLLGWGQSLLGWGQSLLGCPSQDSAWNLLIHATEPQMC